MNYRDAERLRKARWVMKVKHQYSDAEIRRARLIIRELETT